MENRCSCDGEIKEFDMLFECVDCKSKVWKRSFGREFKAKEAMDLFSGKIIVACGFKAQNGSLYDTKVQLVNGEVILIFDEETKSTKICSCECGGDVVKIPKGYKCKDCEKIVWEMFVNKELKLNEIKKLFKGEPLYLKNLRSKKGNVFDAEIYFDGKEIELEYIA